MRKLGYAVPALLFLAIALLFATPFALRLDSHILPSALIDLPAPEFALPPIEGRPQTLGLATADLSGKPSIVNVFASWCVPCLAEHPMISRLAEEGFTVYGIDHRDPPDAVGAWLDRNGNPYARIGADRDASVSIDWGVTGVPETFLIDRKGRIRHKIVGPMTPDIFAEEVLPWMRELAR
ncbi:MAG: DsbE family thiol:disulfide interchange protein [Alphaproteobacteria bacterium]|nr:DsbE family thiol:disulfide interchange protein [Alphaproteobacteria bacterium]